MKRAIVGWALLIVVTMSTSADGGLPGIPGDANGDGRVDETDAAMLADHWGKSGYYYTDFNDDGVVNAADAAILAANWGKGTTGESGTAPEPNTILLLLVASVGLLARRGRPRREHLP